MHRETPLIQKFRAKRQDLPCFPLQVCCIQPKVLKTLYKVAVLGMQLSLERITPSVSWATLKSFHQSAGWRKCKGTELELCFYSEPSYCWKQFWKQFWSQLKSCFFIVSASNRQQWTIEAENPKKNQKLVEFTSILLYFRRCDGSVQEWS